MSLHRVFVLDAEKNRNVIGFLGEAVLDEFFISTIISHISHPIFVGEFGEPAWIDAIRILETRPIFQSDERVRKLVDVYKNIFRETDPRIRAQKFIITRREVPFDINLQFYE